MTDKSKEPKVVAPTQPPTEPPNPTPNPPPPAPLPSKQGQLLSQLLSLFDWDGAEVPHAMAKLGELKRAYEHISAVVLARQQVSPTRLHCWVWDHRRKGYDGGPVPESVLSQCNRTIPNGKWAFRDDGNFEKRFGHEVRVPVVCCKPRCADIYFRWRNDQKAKQRGAMTATEAGIELR